MIGKKKKLKMMFSVEQDDKSKDVQVNLLERVKQKRQELKDLKDGDAG